jgi:coenzyme PQQ precursor peptide PqqA
MGYGRNGPPCRNGRFALFCVIRAREAPFMTSRIEKETTMAWTTPTLVEICIGLEINGYLPAEF